MNKIEFEKVIEKHLPFFENRTAKNWDAEILMRDFAYDILSIPVEKRVSPTEPTFTQKQILDLVRKELTEAFSDDYTPDELKDKIYLVHGYIIGALRR